jgi:hypothetical protein
VTRPAYDKSTGAQATDSSRFAVFDVAGAEKTVPLLSRVLADLVETHAKFMHLRLGQRRAERSRLFASGTTPEPQLSQAIRVVESTMVDLVAELKSMGVVGWDPVHGVAEFSTVVNGSLAYLVYHLGQVSILHWRYRDETKLRPVPDHWRTASASRGQVGMLT